MLYSACNQSLSALIAFYNYASFYLGLFCKSTPILNHFYDCLKMDEEHASSHFFFRTENFAMCGFDDPIEVCKGFMLLSIDCSIKGCDSFFIARRQFYYRF